MKQAEPSQVYLPPHCSGGQLGGLQAGLSQPVNTGGVGGLTMCKWTGQNQFVAHPVNMLESIPIHTRNIPNACLTHAQCMSKPCPKHAQHKNSFWIIGNLNESILKVIFVVRRNGRSTLKEQESRKAARY